MFISTKASAGSSTAPETRATFTCALATALRLTPGKVSNTPFTDLGTVSSQCAGEIAAAYTKGWISGTGPHTFNPQGPLTREQIAKIEVNALDLGTSAADLTSYRPPFYDAGSIGGWAWGYVNEALKIGILNGFANGTFGPAVTFTPAQAGHALTQLTGYVAGKRPSTTYTAPAHVPDVTRANAVYAIGVTFDPNAPDPGYDPLSDVISRDTRLPWLWDAIGRGWIKGATSTSFGVDKTISRAQLLYVAVAALGDGDEETKLMTEPSPYRDDASIPSQFRGAVNEAAELGLIPVGPDGILGPTAPATTYDLDAILERMVEVQGNAPWGTASTTEGREAFLYDLTLSTGQLPYVLPDDGPVSSDTSIPGSTPGVYYIEQAEEQGWLRGLVWTGGSFGPDQPITMLQALELSDIAIEASMYPSSGADDPTAPGAEYAEILAQALSGDHLPFSDSASIPADQRGYVGEALMLGILPSSSSALHAGEPITPQAGARLLARVKATILSRIENPQTAGAPAHIGTTPVEPVSIQDSSASPFETLVFDSHGYKTSAPITATGSTGVSVKVLHDTSVTNGNVTTTVTYPATPIQVSSHTPGMATVTLHAGTATAKVSVPIYAPPLTLLIQPASATVAPNASTVVNVKAKDAGGRVFPVNVDWQLAPPSFAEGYPTWFHWGTLTDWGLSATTTFAAGDNPGQGQITASIPGTKYTASQNLTVSSNVRSLKVSLVDATTGSTTIASVGDEIDIKVQAFDANGHLATTDDVIGANDGGDALEGGTASWSQTATQTGTFYISVGDESNLAAKGADASLPVVVELNPGPETNVALFDEQGHYVASPPPASSGEAVWVRPTDAKGMPTTVTGTSQETIALITAGATFLDSQGGSPVTTVTLDPGSAGVELWLEGDGGTDQAAAVPAVAPIAISTPSEAQTELRAYSNSVPYTVTDGLGNPLRSVPVTFTLTPEGTGAGMQISGGSTLMTDSIGDVQVLISVPTGTTLGTLSAQLTASVGDFATSGPATLTY